ncbi:MAG: anthranilate phosphoribosyltransferase [Planctomycetota bacterium]
MSADPSRSLLETLLAGTPWSSEQAARFMTEVMEGRVGPERLACALGALRVRGETAAELAGFAEATRTAAVKVPFAGACADLVGTGGDGAGTFNISTTAALLAASCGLCVAKHGNRSVSSRSGSADLLEVLGIPVGVSPGEVATALETHGFAFLFAPRFHPGFRHAMPVRRALSVRTVFNVLGPLVNPLAPAFGVYGVYEPRLGPLYAEVLRSAGVQHALVVHGNGTDELTVTGPNQIWEVEDGNVTPCELDAASFGLTRCELKDLAGGSPEDNAHTAVAILTGQMQGPRLDVVCLNAGALLYTAGRAPSIRDGIEVAAEAIDDGHAKRLLEQLRHPG